MSFERETQSNAQIKERYSSRFEARNGHPKFCIQPISPKSFAIGVTMIPPIGGREPKGSHSLTEALATLGGSSMGSGHGPKIGGQRLDCE
jgi:hypothetical protein